MNRPVWHVVAGTILLATSCAGDGSPSLSASTSDESTSTSQAAKNSTAAPPTTTRDPRADWGTPAPNGRRRPPPPRGAKAAARAIERTETALRSPETPPQRLADLGHLNQVVYRTAAAHPRWHDKIRATLPSDLDAVFDTHMSIRRSLTSLHSELPTTVPAWRIIKPEPLKDLLAYYTEAAAESGIEWEYLAAINLIETGMGRIDGLSSAGAQGPMQFIPTTWEEIGEGDVHDPHDAIAAAARYLVQRGGPSDMDAALWGYNNSDHYVEAVKGYASLLRDDPAALAAFYNWEIYYSTPHGLLWFPVGMLNAETTSVNEYVAANPWSAPLE